MSRREKKKKEKRKEHGVLQVFSEKGSLEHKMGLSQGAKERRRRDFRAAHATASEELWVSKDVRSRGAGMDTAHLLHACPTLCRAMHRSLSIARR